MLAIDFLASHTLAFVLCALLLGLLVGSFLNVVIYRLPVMLQRDWQGQAREVLELPPAPAAETFNLILPNSRCPQCGHEIRPRENIPVISWLLLGGTLVLITRMAARLAGDRTLYWPLALTLTPLGGAGLFLGLSATTVKLLRYEGLVMAWVQPARAALLLAAMAWSLLLGWQRLNSARLAMQRQLAASACLLLAVGMIGVGWWLQFWGWA